MTTITPKILSQYSPAILPKSYMTCKAAKWKGNSYVQEIATFDIETTSYYTPTGEPVAWMYHWQFYINGHVVLGRTWDEFDALLSALQAYFAPDILPIYVHNLGFEFSFMAGRYTFDKVFSTKPHVPIRARLGNLEFRDSLILSGMALANLPASTPKLTGDLRYELIRTPETPLTPAEIDYCVNDVVRLAEYLTDKLGNDTLASIPMTRTGYTRREFRESMKKAKQIPRDIKLTPEQYEALKHVYAGGFTHAAAHASAANNPGLYFRNVRSLDITSSYPTVLCAELYPVGNFMEYHPKDKGDIDNALQTCACMLHIKIKNIRALPDVFEHILSLSKMVNVTNPSVDNGRIASADFVEFWCNEIDFCDIRSFYEWDECRIVEMHIAPKGRLPRSFVYGLFDYYAKKTSLKGITGQLPDGSDAEIMYAKAKEAINAAYGCCVTDPVKAELLWTGYGWEQAEPDLAAALDAFNKSRNRWNSYAWGVWCTSYARHNLFRMMKKCGPDYLYADTDSLKILNYEDHKAEFDAYNAEIVWKLENACYDLNINPALIRPKNSKGKECPLGVWTDEGEYSRFKTLGAKRYLAEHDGEITPTVAGAPKKAFKTYLNHLVGDAFDNFNIGLTVPAKKSGKRLHRFQKEDWAGSVTDYLGNTADVFATALSTHISPTTVSMDIPETYALYLSSIGNVKPTLDSFEVI